MFITLQGILLFLVPTKASETKFVSVRFPDYLHGSLFVSSGPRPTFYLLHPLISNSCINVFPSELCILSFFLFYLCFYQLGPCSYPYMQGKLQFHVILSSLSWLGPYLAYSEPEAQMQTSKPSACQATAATIAAQTCGCALLSADRDVCIMFSEKEKKAHSELGESVAAASYSDISYNTAARSGQVW